MLLLKLAAMLLSNVSNQIYGVDLGKRKEVNESDDSRRESRLSLDFKVVYEDQEVLVIRAPTEDELVNIILRLLNEKPMNIKEIHHYLPGIASEDKIRKTLTKLVNEGKVYVLEDGRFIVVGR